MEIEKDANHFDQDNQDAKANLDNQDKSNAEKDTQNSSDDADHQIDYKTKFSESSREAQRLLEENKRLSAEAEARKQAEEKAKGDLFPGFEELDEDAKKNLLDYTATVEKRVTDKINKDPALAFARQVYNEKVWEKAFESVSAKYPELKNSKEEFKTKYFQPNNVPENIEAILGDVSKIYLFDKAKDIGAEEEKKRAGRIDSQRANGGDKQPKSSRSLDEWQRLAQENPAKFAKMSKEYHADLDSGKLRE